MNDLVKVTPSHTKRTAFVYIRQSSPAQVHVSKVPSRRNWFLHGHNIADLACPVNILCEIMSLHYAKFGKCHRFLRRWIW
jgi:hypothetical protein